MNLTCTLISTIVFFYLILISIGCCNTLIYKVNLSTYFKYKAEILKYFGAFILFCSMFTMQSSHLHYPKAPHSHQLPSDSTTHLYTRVIHRGRSTQLSLGSMRKPECPKQANNADTRRVQTPHIVDRGQNWTQISGAMRQKLCWLHYCATCTVIIQFKC